MTHFSCCNFYLHPDDSPLFLPLLSFFSFFQGPLCVSDLLQLLPLVYSLWPDAAPLGTLAPGPFSLAEEQELQHACLQAVLAQIAAAAKGKLAGSDALSLDCLPSAMIDRMKKVGEKVWEKVWYFVDIQPSPQLPVHPIKISVTSAVAITSASYKDFSDQCCGNYQCIL
jgi:hypothetical protein